VSPVTSDGGHTVSEAMEAFDDYDWLADVRQTDERSWMMLYAPAADPDDETAEAFTDDMEYLLESANLDTVTEIANGWVITTSEQ
jgi:hypothetical protein